MDVAEMAKIRIASGSDGELVPTRQSLLERLRNLDDHDSWQEFFDTYWKLIYCAAIKFGLSDTEAEEVVQETIIGVARKMETFRYEPQTCSFKGWLMHVTRCRIADQFRRRRPASGSFNSTAAAAFWAVVCNSSKASFVNSMISVPFFWFEMIIHTHVALLSPPRLRASACLFLPSGMTSCLLLY